MLDQGKLSTETWVDICQVIANSGRRGGTLWKKLTNTQDLVKTAFYHTQLKEHWHSMGTDPNIGCPTFCSIITLPSTLAEK